jgi:hypothetical protein
LAKSLPVGPLLIFLVGIIAIVAIWRNRQLLSFGPSLPVTQVKAAAISPEPTCPAGEECAEDDQGRFDCDEAKGDSYEATWCGSFSGDDLTIKLYGPPHSNDGDCCWCVLHIKPDSGQFVGGGEGPHPSSNCEDKGEGESIGTTSDICVKAVIQPGPHVTGYAVVDGAWKQMIDYTGDCGCDETASEKTGDQVTFRCDGDFNTTCATVKEFTADGSEPPPTTAPPPETTPPAEEEEPPAEEEEPEEEEESSGAAARSRRRRRSNLARSWRRPVTRAMMSTYYPHLFRTHRAIRIGNVG